MWGSIAIAAASLLGSSMSSNASKNAAGDQEAAAAIASATQLQMYNQTRADLLPAMTSGNAALRSLDALIGLTPQPSDTPAGGGGAGTTGSTSSSRSGAGLEPGRPTHQMQAAAGSGGGIFAIPGSGVLTSFPNGQSQAPPDSITIPGTTITGGNPSTYGTLGGIIGGATLGPLGALAGHLVGSQFNRGGQLSPTSVSLPSQTFQLPQTVDTSNLTPVAMPNFHILPVGADPKEAAQGGPIGAGHYIVGEEGTEHIYLTPGSSGFVVPNKKTAQQSPTAAHNYQIGSGGKHRLLGGGMRGAVPRDGEPSFQFNPASRVANQFGPPVQTPILSTPPSPIQTPTNPLVGQLGQAPIPHAPTLPQAPPGPGNDTTPIGSRETLPTPSPGQPGIISLGPRAAPPMPPTGGPVNYPGQQTPAYPYYTPPGGPPASDPTQGNNVALPGSGQTPASIMAQAPQYQFVMQQGLQGLDNSAAARGGLLSGGHIADILNYSQGVASQQFQNIYNNLAQVASLGESAGAMVGNAGTYAGMGMSNALMAGGNAAAAGEVGSANSYNSMLGNLGFMYAMNPNMFGGGTGGG